MAERIEELGSHSLAFVEGLWAEWAADPAAVPLRWREYFESQVQPGGQVPRQTGPSHAPRSLFNPPSAATNGYAAGSHEGVAERQYRVDELIRSYRARGHMIAHLDPLQLPRPRPPELDPAYYGFTAEDLDRRVATATMEGARERTLREVLETLYNTYCRFIGVQFMHIDDLEIRRWLQRRMEGTENRLKLEHREQLRILTRLNDAVIFEEFVQKKFLGAKSFSLEGGESLIPLLGLAIEKAGAQGVQTIVIGMAHRGRLNVLANIMGKSAQQIFREFQDADPELHKGGGDVKYHLGHSTTWTTSAGQQVHLSLCFNPSHLEFVNPVVLGRVRAKQDRRGDTARQRGMAILIHGDAAFAGEGVSQETLNLSQLAGYDTGGALHVVVNNQIGFTTQPAQGRSTVYATDVAKMLQIPIFHVNGEDSEAVAQVVRLALDFRSEFRRDVVIDMYCYRRRGHNEGDEPAFTQPLLYAAIEQRKSVRDSFLTHLLRQGEVTREEAAAIEEERRQRLEAELARAKADEPVPVLHQWSGSWNNFHGGPESTAEPVATAVPLERLAALTERLARVPAGFQVNPKLARILDQRRDMGAGQRPCDWALGEALAYATLATEGVKIRLTGQDCERGTFSHRHAVWHDVEDDQRHCIFSDLDPQQATVELHNSPLSEVGVLGFEYGYSLNWPEGLVLWEAQFGDFANVAQVIIDQFLCSAEDKWGRLSGLVMLLPHGFEGMGPEHSSARLERFLMLTAEDNIQICNLTTPAQIFHVLRRQALRKWRKPLVIMTPKSLLRNPAATCPIGDLATGGFQKVIPDRGADPAKVQRILLCSGKVYYDLAERRQQLQQDSVAIVRVEQLYPHPVAELEAVLAPYAAGCECCWVQEEPSNMGAWRFIWLSHGERLGQRFRFRGIAREESASPATGSATAHRLEQEAIIAAAVGTAAGSR
ncbi:MAG: 2-oxoglutarate dehydrogenase E1 component [Fimbriimonadaceae bacterium]|nr:2-oxoglutarate dehydrogenase E1 component [Fimbriimonadaceae bacterium]